MKESRQIAAAIDLRVRQLAVHNLSDSALVDHMVGYMADLQRLWNSTTDEELAALCDEYPGIVRYATLMENLSEALRTGVSVPAHVKQLTPFPEPLKRAMEKLLPDGAALERSFQERMDESRASRFQTKTIQAPAYDTADLDDLYVRWCAVVEQLIADLGASKVSDQA
jgi:hypothetical protein